MDLGWASFNEILALARMKSATQMKSKPMAWMKLNPPTASHDFIRPKGGFHHRRRFHPPERVDLVKKNGNRITITVLFWQGHKDLAAFCWERQIATTQIDHCQRSYGSPSVANGLSHGLKIARQLSIFTPVCGLVPPFRIPQPSQN